MADLPGDTDRWQFSYTVANVSLPGTLDDFLVYFEFGPGIDPFIKSLKEEGTPGGWTAGLYEPSAIQLGAMYEGYTTPGSGLLSGQSQGGFEVSFDWLGGGAPPESQYYGIYDSSYNLVDTGLTSPAIPEPAGLQIPAFLALSMASIAAQRLRKGRLR